MAMLLATLMSTASAASPAVPAASTPVVTRATIKFELLQALADDGIITAEQKSAAAAKYTAKDDTTRLVAYTDDESWTRHVTWSLTLKCLGLLLLFAAMWGWVKEFARHFNGWLRKIPLVVYYSAWQEWFECRQLDKPYTMGTYHLKTTSPAPEFPGY